MDAKCCLSLVIILCLATILESRVIIPIDPDEGIPLSINPLEEDKMLGMKPAVWGPSIDDIVYPDYSVPIFRPLKDEDDYKPGRDVNKEDNQPGTNPEIFPLNADRGPKEMDDVDKSDDENFIDPLEGVDSGKSGSDDEDFRSPPDEDKPINKNGDESEIGDAAPEESEEKYDNKEYKPEDEEKPDEERKENEPVEDGLNKEHEPEDEEKPDEEESKDDSNDKEHEPEEEEKPDEERKEDEDEEKYEPENDDGKKYVPEEESTSDEKKDVDEGTASHEDDKNDEESILEEGEKGFFSGSIFDTPFFNLGQVKNYFSKLDRALMHVFRQTLDEALLLNGTYANTTEEEVDIGGKKYIVTKSVLKGADNNSMMYIEALSTKPKMNDSEIVEDIDIKNVTST